MTCCPVLELRQYTLHPGQRDVLIELFERELLESQEAVGIRIVGQFCDVDDPDRFVWLRGFTDMNARRAALEAFYGGPVWAEHRDAANATMVDSSDVLLLRPLRPDSGFPEPVRARPPIGAIERPMSLVIAAIAPAGHPVAQHEGAPPLAWFETEPAENTFPALPVRTDEHVVVSFTSYQDRDQVPVSSAGRRLRLAPTARPLLR